MDWTKIGAIAGIAALIVAIAALIVEVTKPDVRPFVGPILLVLAIAGVLVFLGAPGLRNFSRRSRLPFELLLDECESILDEYRKLAFDYAEASRLPLNTASWPKHGEIWLYEHVQMVIVRTRLFDFLVSADQVWTARELKTPPSASFKKTSRFS